MEDKIKWKRARALTMHTFREAKQKSWREYVSTLIAYTPSSKVWEQLNKLRGRSPRKINILKINDVCFSSVEEIGEKLAEHFE